MNFVVSMFIVAVAFVATTASCKKRTPTNLRSEAAVSPLVAELKQKWAQGRTVEERVRWCEPIGDKSQDPFFKLFSDLKTDGTGSERIAFPARLASLTESTKKLETNKTPLDEDFPYAERMGAYTWSDSLRNNIELGIFSPNPLAESHTWMEPLDTPRFVERLRKRKLEFAFYNLLMSALNLDFFLMSLADLVAVKKSVGLSFDEILSKYEELNSVKHIGVIGKLETPDFKKLISRSVVWREGYDDFNFEDVPWEELKSSQFDIGSLKEILAEAAKISAGIASQGFPIPHGRYTHRLQTYFQMRYLDACNHESGQAVPLMDLRGLSGEKTGYLSVWRSLFDEIRTAISLGNPILVGFLSGLVSEELGCFAMNGEDETSCGKL